MTDTALAIHTRGLTRRFGDNVAVNGLDLAIERGRIYGFLGPNGSGKTTTIRMLAGLLSPSAGSIEVLGLDIPRQAERLKHRIGYMTQRFSLYDDLTVGENLWFVAEIFALAPAAARQRVARQVSEYHLQPVLRQRAGTLSGGQRQRLSLAAATLHDPDLLFLDEPTSAVDPQSRRDFWEKLFELSDLGTTILVSTHYMDEAERCHHLAILDSGVLAIAGEPAHMMRDIGTRVVLVTSPQPRACTAQLRDLDAVAGLTQIGNGLRVQVQPRVDDPAAYLAAELDRAALRYQAEEVSASLEDVFVAATHKPKAAAPT